MSDEERRARLATRHAVAPSYRVRDPEAATRAMTVLHATEPATVYLSLAQRIDGLGVADVDRALYVDRTLVKQLAMRRTLFVFPRDLLPAAWGSASARVAEFERRRMVKDLEKAGIAADGEAWIRTATTAVLEALADRPEGMTAMELRAAVAHIAIKIDVTAGSVWGSGRVLNYLGASGEVIRGTNSQHWQRSRPRWTSGRHWLGVDQQGAVDESAGPIPNDPLDVAAGYAEIVRRWLVTFGPGTEDDLVWWLGGTKAVVRAALSALEAVEVSLDDGGTGWLLPDDLEPVEEVAPWAALLPVLDPTVMGWKQRNWYLGPHAPQLFDRNGNAGTTAWWRGRIVGGWRQDEAGRVGVRLVESVPAAARRALTREAERLTAWLDGANVGTIYPSPLMKATTWEHPS